MVAAIAACAWPLFQLRYSRTGEAARSMARQSIDGVGGRRVEYAVVESVEDAAESAVDMVRVNAAERGNLEARPACRTKLD